MVDAEIQILLVLGALTTLVVAAFLNRGIARIFLIAQAGYWSLSYVGRPLLLLWVQPEPRFGDNIPDPRLAVIGYDHGLAMVLRPVAFGLWVYAVLALAYAIWRRRRGVAEPTRPADPNFVPTLATAYVIGMLGRAASYATGTISQAGETHASSPLLHFVTLMAVMGSLGLIIFIRPASAKVTVAVIAVLAAGEFAWTVATESKTPILGAALAIAIRFAMTGWTRARAGTTALIAILGIVAFGWLQSFKASPAAKAQQYLLDSNYPLLVRPFLSIFRRFDLLEAATDSYYLEGRPWLSWSQVVRDSALSLVPSQVLGNSKFQSGTAWASDVRGSSVDMTHVSVSLAEGNINEGFVLGGYGGVIIGVVVTFVLLMTAVRALQGTNMIVLVSVGLALTELPVLFERGILGAMEVLGKTLQVAVFIWIIYLLVGEYRRRHEESRSAPQYSGIESVDALEMKGRTMKLTDYIRVCRRRWLIIVVGALLGVTMAAAYVSTAIPKYQATSRVYITMATGTSVDDSYHGALSAQQRVTSYADLVTSTNVAQRVIDELGLAMSPSELQSKIEASFPPATALIDISVTDESPERAKILTDKVVAQFRRLTDELETTVAGAAPAARVTVIDSAETPTSPVSVNSNRIYIVGLLAGLTLGCLAAFFRERFDRKLRTSTDLDPLLPVPTLAIVDIGEPGAEGEIRRLRARISQSCGEATSLMVTSFSSHSEPQVAIHVSKAFADTGRKVVLVDADTTGCGSSKYLPEEYDFGLAELLRTTSSSAGGLVTLPDSGISVLPLGAVDGHTSDLLASERFADIMLSLRSSFEYVIIGTAPVTSSADALEVSARCDGVVGVVELGKTTSHQVRGALATFQQGGSGLLGVVAISRKSGSWFARQSKRLRRNVDQHGVREDIDRGEDIQSHGEWQDDSSQLQSAGTPERRW